MWAWVLYLAVLAGCAPLGDGASSFGPVGDAVRYATKPAAAPNVGKLPAGFGYLQVRVDGRQSLLASVPGQSEDEFWYSPQSELVQLRQGRLWRVLGMTTEWRSQQAQPPAWADVPASGEAVAWVRQVDRMPGYRWAERDEVRTRRLLVPPAKVADVLAAWPQAQWFEDSVQSRDGAGRPWAFVQRFALWQGRVVYSEQCIAPDLCLALTRLQTRGPGFSGQAGE